MRKKIDTAQLEKVFPILGVTFACVLLLTLCFCNMIFAAAALMIFRLLN